MSITLTAQTEGFSITGGYVYRGCAIPGLQGTYFYADYVTNNVWSLRYNRDTGVQTEFTVRNTQITPSLDGFAVNQISSFGEDANGEIYICDQGSTAGTGAIFKIVPTTGNTPCTPPCPAVDINCDGVVDAADYVVWRKGGSPNPNSIGDYSTWRAQFGQPSGSSAGVGVTGSTSAVPEPATLAIFITGLLAMCSRRRTVMS